MSRRRKAREIALQSLYASEVGGSGWKDALGETIRRREASAEASEYASRLVEGVSGMREELDSMISSHLDNWRIERVAVVDRIIMEIALYELLEHPEVPEGVIIDEAIEIAKRFSTEKAGAFVNGLLDRLAGEVRGG
jgi:N utilization substance protein B